MSKENWLDALNDDVCDIRGLTLAVQKVTEQLKIQNRIMAEDLKDSKRRTDAAVRKADAAWEFVVKTYLEMKRPLWKRGLASSDLLPGIVLLVSF